MCKVDVEGDIQHSVFERGARSIHHNQHIDIGLDLVPPRRLRAKELQLDQSPPALNAPGS